MTNSPLSVGFVEDSDIDFEMAMLAVRELDPSPRVFRARSIREADGLLSRQFIRLFVVDVNLTDGSGISFVRRVRGGEHSREQRVVMFSTSTNPADRTMAMEAGADAYFEKPADAERYLGVVRQMLASWGSAVS